jgi:cytochrome c oxidase subunit III
VVSETHGPVDLEHGLSQLDDDGHGHGPVQHQFDDMAQQRESFFLGMWLFLATEVMMFGGLFFTYFLYRFQYDQAFHVGSAHLNPDLGTANTFVLLFSSLTMALAVHSASTGNRMGIVKWLAVTWVLGAAFLGIKAVEWHHDWEIGLIPGLNWTYYDNPANAAELAKLQADGVSTHSVMMYFVVYFCMTGLHAIHMIIGLGAVAVFMWLGYKGRFAIGNDQPVEILGLYWHLVDIIWVFLFPLLYLIHGWHPTFLGGAGGGGGGH